MPEGVLRIVQLNAGSLLEPGWADRREEIVAWLDQLRPDIICLQEMWEDEHNANTAAWIADRINDGEWHDGEWHWTFGGGPIGTELWPDQSLRFGSAVLSRWPIDETVHHALPIADRSDRFVANVPWELVHVRTAGVDVFSCHLASAPRDGRHRRLQVLAIDDVISEVRDEIDRFVAPGSKLDGMPAILCGDFNAEPDSDEIRFLSSLTMLDGRTTFYQDAWRVAGEGPGYTQDWRVNPIASAMNINRKRIDYVFVGDGYQRARHAGRVLTANLAFHEPLTGLLASDHSGLVAEVVWPDRPD